MDKKITEKLDKIIREILGVEVTSNLSMEKVPSWDSLRHIQLIAEIEQVFGIEIDSEDTLAMTNIRSIRESLEKYLHGK